MIVTSRPEIARRARVLWPMQSVPYSQTSTGRPPGWLGAWFGYRWDCSGFAAAVTGQPAPGRSTATLDQICTPIAWADAEPGDLWGKIGPRTAGSAGHVAIIVETPRTHPQGKWVIVDHGGGSAGGSSYGPDLRTFNSPPSEYRAWRVNATMGAHMALGDRELSQGATGSDVEELQNALIRLGLSVGAAGPDGQYGPATAAAVKTFQAGHGLVADGVCGPKTVAVIRVELAKLAQAEMLAELRPLVLEIVGAEIAKAVEATIRNMLPALIKQVIGSIRLTMP